MCLVPEPIGELLDLFYMHKMNEGCKPKTLSWYRFHVEHFVKTMDVETLDDWTALNISKFLHKKRETCTSGGLLMYFRVIRTVSKYFYLQEFLEKDIVPKIPKPRHKYEQKEGFSLEEVQELLKAAKRTYYPELNVALIQTLYDTGIRAGELCSLKLTDIDYLQHTIIVEGKTGKRTCPIGRTALRKLKRYIKQKRRAAPSIREVFVNRKGKPLSSLYVTQKVKRLASSAGINKTYTGPHALRHGFAVQYLRNGGDVMYLKEVLGHKDIAMTQRYVKLAGKDLNEAHTQFSPVEQMDMP